MFIFLGVGRAVHFCACSSVLRLNYPESSTGIHRNGSLREQRQGLCFRFFFPCCFAYFLYIYFFYFFLGVIYFLFLLGCSTVLARATLPCVFVPVRHILELGLDPSLDAPPDGLQEYTAWLASFNI